MYCMCNVAIQVKFVLHLDVVVIESHVHLDAVLMAPIIAPDVLPIFLDSLFCSGSEATLLDCPPFPYGLHQCSSRETAHLQCKGIS